MGIGFRLVSSESSPSKGFMGMLRMGLAPVDICFETQSWATSRTSFSLWHWRTPGITQSRDPPTSVGNEASNSHRAEADNAVLVVDLYPSKKL